MNIKRLQAKRKTRKGNERVTLRTRRQASPARQQTPNGPHRNWAVFLKKAISELGWTIDESCEGINIGIGVLKKARRGQNIRQISRQTIEAGVNHEWNKDLAARPSGKPLEWPAWEEDAPWSGRHPSPAVADVPAPAKQLLDQARELSFEGHHRDADAKCLEALALVKAGGGLPATTVWNKTELEGLDYYLRILYYHQWRQIKAEFPAPHDVAESKAAQAELDHRVPIDLSALHEMLDALGLRTWRFPLPVSKDRFALDYTEDAKKRFCQAVTAAMQKVFAAGSAETRAALERKITALTRYLCEDDSLPEGAIDLAWVPGYRSHLRAEKAGELYKAGKVRKILLTGDRPYYAQHEPPTALTEALAMTVYLIDKRPDFGVRWADVIPESTARDTRENVDKSRPILQAEKDQNGRASSVLIVTSPYHLRRAWLMWSQYKRQLEGLKVELIADLRRAASRAREELLPDRWHRYPLGVEAYMTECWKIHGGRATAKF